MKNPVIIINLFFLLFIPAQRPVQVPPSEPSLFLENDWCASPNTAWQPGEEIKYSINYNWGIIWLEAGDVTFKVEDQDSLYKFSALGKTHSDYDLLFKVRDSYESWVDKATLLPVRAVRKVAEGKYRMYEEYYFDQENHQVRVLRGKTPEDLTELFFDVDGCIHDILSMLYYLRNVDDTNLKAGDHIPMQMFMDREIYDLDLTLLGRLKDHKIRGVGRYNVLDLSPQTIAGFVFKEGDRMHVQVSDDSSRLPLYVETPISVGSIKAKLVSHKGTRYPLKKSNK